MEDNFLLKLGRARNAKRFIKLIRRANNDQMRSLVHATVRIMRKEVPVSPRLRNRIIQNRRFLRHVANPGYSLSRKKKYLMQKGGSIAGGIGGLARLFIGLMRMAPMMARSMPAISRALPGVMRRVSSLPTLSRM